MRHELLGYPCRDSGGARSGELVIMGMARCGNSRCYGEGSKDSRGETVENLD